MTKWQYTLGWHDLGGGVYAYLQPDGSWGWSNAGLVREGDHTLLIDTLFDLELTQRMLDSVKEVAGGETSIETLVITHSNADHWYGNELVDAGEIISTRRCAEEMRQMPPETLSQIIKGAAQLGEAGEFILRCFGRFRFDDIKPTYPTKTFEGREVLLVGSREVVLEEVGPAHTGSDLLVWVPHNRTLFAGDILFVGGTPIMWSGPVENWIRACDRILELGAEVMVPGHGPVTGPEGVRRIRAYWEFLAGEAGKRFEAGMPAWKAAMDIPLGEFARWGERERTVVNVETLYRQFSGQGEPPSPLELFAQMARYNKEK
jgi:glyoxylase-like metal-dependent hydrolase (beta-lactamase superfamily II)